MSNPVRAVLDLLVTLAWLAAAVAVVVVEPFGDGFVAGALRVAVVLPVILFVPGYALVSLLYPERAADRSAREGDGLSLTGLERIGLAVPLSVALVPIVALVLNFTPFGIRARPTLAGIVLVTVPLTLGAMVARLRVPADRRYRTAVGARLGSGIGTYFGTSSTSLRNRGPFEATDASDRLLNLLLVVAVVALFASVGYAAVGPTLPSQDGSFTELYLLDGDGEHLLGTEADPTGDGAVPATIVVENHEGQTETYTAVIVRQQVDVGEDRTTVREKSVVDTVELEVQAGATKRVQRTFEGGGENVRVQVLLFRGDAPADPSAEEAYRETRFWPAGQPAGSGSN